MEGYREQIEAYLSGELSGDALASFEALLSGNEALREEVVLARQINLMAKNEFDREQLPQNEYTQELRTFLKSDRAQELKNALKNAEQSYQQQSNPPKSRRKFYIAAILVLLLGATFFFQMFKQPSSEKMYANYFSLEDMPSLTQRDDGESSLKLALSAFKTKDYSAANNNFKEYLSLNANADPRIYLYTGISLLEMDQFENALLEFDKLIDSESLDRSKGYWFKALAYLKVGNNTKAKEVLSELQSTDFNFNKAQQLLEDL